MSAQVLLAIVMIGAILRATGAAFPVVDTVSDRVTAVEAGWVLDASVRSLVVAIRCAIGDGQST